MLISSIAGMKMILRKANECMAKNRMEWSKHNTLKKALCFHNTTKNKHDNIDTWLPGAVYCLHNRKTYDVRKFCCNQ